EMAVWILEHARIAAQRRVVRWLKYLGARLGRECEHFLHVRFLRNAVAQHEFGHRRRLDFDAGLARQAFAWPQGEAEPRLQFEKSGRPEIVIDAHDAASLPPESVTVETHGLFEVSDAESNDGDVRFHGGERYGT